MSDLKYKVIATKTNTTSTAKNSKNWCFRPYPLHKAGAPEAKTERTNSAAGNPRSKAAPPRKPKRKLAL